MPLRREVGRSGIRDVMAPRVRIGGIDRQFRLQSTVGKSYTLTCHKREEKTTNYPQLHKLNHKIHKHHHQIQTRILLPRKSHSLSAFLSP